MQSVELFLKIVLILLFFTTFPFPLEKDFYDFHVYECEEAHKLNKTFAVCSGFLYEPSEADFNNVCAIHPIEDCKTHVKHGSNTGQMEYRPLLNIFNLHY